MTRGRLSQVMSRWSTDRRDPSIESSNLSSPIFCPRRTRELALGVSVNRQIELFWRSFVAHSFVASALASCFLIEALDVYECALVSCKVTKTLSMYKSYSSSRVPWCSGQSCGPLDSRGRGTLATDRRKPATAVRIRTGLYAFRGCAEVG